MSEHQPRVEEWKRIRRIVVLVTLVMAASGAIGSCAGALRDYAEPGLPDPSEPQLELHIT